jgi:nicotinamidase-related amidase
LTPTQPQFRLHPSLEERDPAGWKSVVKQYSSVFPGTGLAEWLREKGIDTITLVGYMTNNCILASAADAEPHQFNAEVLSDATGAVDLANEAGSADARTVHTTLLTLLNSNLAAVAATDEWVRAVAAGEALGKGNLVESAAAGAVARVWHRPSSRTAGQTR